MFLKIVKILNNFIIVLSIMLALDTQIMVVSGESMMPTFVNEEIGVTMRHNKYQKIERFDVAIIRCEKTGNQCWIKRVIGLPGDVIQYKNNHLYINNKEVKETFKTNTPTEDFGPIRLKEDEYYVMGDNREHSYDSRKVGAFKKEDIKNIGLSIIQLPEFIEKIIYHRVFS